MKEMQKMQRVTVRLEVEEPILVDHSFHSPEKAAAFFQEKIGNMDREYLAIVCLDNIGHPTTYSVASIGGLNKTIFSPRELIKTAILSNASGIIIAHNHPSGSLDASLQDQQATRNLHKITKLLDISLLDHIIVTYREDEYYSFAEHGELMEKEDMLFDALKEIKL